MTIPFLYEIRSAIDWLCIPTSLTFFEWMRIETIYAQVFQIKCSRNQGKDLPRGVKKPWISKIFLGGGVTALIILILWFPLIFFAYSSSLGFPSRPAQFGLLIQFKSYEPIYVMNVEQEDMRELTEEEWKIFRKPENWSTTALNFLNEFDERDVVIVKLRTDSTSLWTPSPPNIENLISHAKNLSRVFKMGISYEVLQNRLDQSIKLSDGVEKVLQNHTRLKLAKILEEESFESLVIENIMPKMLHLKKNGNMITLSNDLLATRK